MQSKDSPHTSFELARAWLRAFNQQDWESLKACLHPDILFTQRTQSLVDKGLAAVFASFHDWRAGHTELNGQMIAGFGDQDRAALEVHWMGTTRDGEPVDFYACLLFRALEDRFVEISDYY